MPLTLGCPDRDREKHEVPGTINRFSNPYTPLVNEPLCSINVAYPHLKEGIQRLATPPGQNWEPVLPPCFVRWVSEPEEVRNSPLKQEGIKSVEKWSPQTPVQAGLQMF